MSVEVAAIVARLEMDTKQFEQRLDKAERSIRDVEDTAEKGSGKMGGLASSMKGVAVAAAAGMGLNFMKGQIAGAVNAASDLDESINAMAVAAPGAADELMRMGENAASSMGISQRAFNEAFVSFSAFGEKIDSSNLAGTFQDYATRAGDFASVMNLDMDEALTKFRSGLAGETEPLRAFGIDLSAAAVAAYAVEKGISASASSMTEAEKVQARYGLLMQQTDKFAGDFANTSGEMANQQRILTAEWEDAQAMLGGYLIPAMSAFLAVLIKIVQAIPDHVTNFETGISAISRVTQKLFDVIDPFSDTWTDADEAMYKFQVTLGHAKDRLNDGIKPFQVAAEWLAHLSNEGALTAETMKAVAEATGASADDMVRAGEVVHEYADELGLTEKQLRALDGLTEEYATQAAQQQIQAYDDAWAAARKLEYQTRQAATAQDDLTAATWDSIDALKSSVDPVFAAIGAAQRYTETLRKVDEDGERTNEELVELARVTLDAQIAMDNVDSGNIQQMLALLQGSLGLSADEAEELLRQLHILDGSKYVFTVEERRTMVETREQRYRNVPQGVDFGLLKYHTGGVIGGRMGTDEVLTVLQKGEGVIDRDTMRNGIGAATTVYVTVEGNVTTEQELAEAVRQSLLETQRRGGTVTL